MFVYPFNHAITIHQTTSLKLRLQIELLKTSLKEGGVKTVKVNSKVSDRLFGKKLLATEYLIHVLFHYQFKLFIVFM